MDHYELLGVPRDADARTLKRAYRRLARELHPDRNHGDTAEATARMSAINLAYDTLRDPVRRYDYDRQLRRKTGGPGQQRPASASAEPTPPPPDDAARRARREAKEREAAEARARGYSDPSGGFFG